MAATAVMTSATLLRIIRDNKLVEEEPLQACLNTLSPEVVNGDDPSPIADALVEKKLLTRFQANLLIQGKSKSLRITSKYRLLDRIGAGGMGLVYLCEHIRMKRLVALKVLPNSQSKEPGNLERFYREAQAVAALKHPNIVQAYDVDNDNGIHYLVMEYIDGINLEKLLSLHGPIDPIRAAHYIAQAADGLQHAADKGLVHRDIKPSNLLIDREGYVKVLDMGLARFFDTRGDNITAKFDNNAVIGTADFISPEQALNSHDVDIRADIYSLGCTFYYLLSGKAPYHDANVTQKLLLHQIRDPVPIEQLVPGLEPRLAAVIRTMMAKKPEDRYQTPGDVVAALAPWTENAIEPPSEIPASSRIGQFDRSGGSTMTNGMVTSPSKKQAPRPGRGTLTERVAESAIRRIDGLPKDRDEEGAFSKKRLIIGGALALVAIGGLILVASKPWEDDAPTPKEVAKADERNDQVDERPEPVSKKTESPPKTTAFPKPQPLGTGLVQVKLEPKSPRPSIQNGNLRAQPTDVLFFSGAELSRDSKEEAGMLGVLRSQMVGAKSMAGGTEVPIIPYAIALGGDATIPNTLLTIDDKGGLRPLSLDTDFLLTKYFTGVKPESNLLVRENAVLPKGMTTINSLVSSLVDLSASEGGSTLRVGSGVLLFAGKTLGKVSGVGTGKNPLILDFNGRTGYVTICCEQDFTKPPTKDYVLRAQMTNLGNEPLVLSGLSGNSFRLDHPANANSKLVVQGIQMIVKDKHFRVYFTSDSNLGTAQGPVKLVSAALIMSAASTVEVDRPLQISKLGQLAGTNAKGQLRWTGKISGDKLAILGSGQVVLTREDNDFSGGTEVSSGTLVLDAEKGVPAGTGILTVQQNGTLTGTGTIQKDLIVKGGTLQPGTDDGRPLVVNGKLQLDRFVPSKDSKMTERYPTIRYRFASSKARPLVCTAPLTIDLKNANLVFSVVGDWSPGRDDKCVLIENRSQKAIENNFREAPQFGVVKSSDGKWSAKITYVGNAGDNKISGGHDVMLYDFAKLNP